MNAGDSWTIRRNKERYPGMNKSDPLPDEFIVGGVSPDQAQFIARELSLIYSGCEYIFYVVGLDD